MKRRILSFVLCLAMLVGMIPTSVFATETEETAHTCAWTYAPTEDGTQHIATCEDCGESYTEDHTLEDGQCTLCHWISEASQETTLPETQETEAPETTAAAEETEATDATEATEAVCLHENTQEVAEIPATCTAPGKTAGVICADCGCYVSGGEELPQLPHTFEEGVCTQCQYVCPHEQTETREESEDCCAGTYCLLCGMLLPEEESDLPYGFLGMPQEYTLSADQVESKAFLVDNDCLTTLGDLEEGVDYVENSIMFWAETEEEAQAIAAAYNAELTSYGCMVGVATLQGATVAQALEVAMTPDNGMPAVDPVYRGVYEPTVDVPYSPAGQMETVGIQAPILQVWENFKDGDPHLADPYDTWYQWHHDMINTYEAWGVTQGAGVTVAILDSGVETSNTDLQGKVTVLSNSSFLSGYYDQHGTNVAGVIAATQGNGWGGAGVAPEADILSIRVVDSQGYFSYSTLARGVNAAANWGVDIINISLSLSYSSSYYSSTLQTAINYAYNNDVTIFAAMGNLGTNSMQAPACMDHVISVCAVDRDGYLCEFSNYGSWADLAAPGQHIVTCWTDDNIGWVSGTSMASPIAAGVAALYISALGYNPGSDRVESAMKKAVNKGYGSTQMGKGVIDAAKLFSSDRSAPYISLNQTYSLEAATMETVSTRIGTLSYTTMDTMTQEELDSFYHSALYSMDNTTNAEAVTESARSNMALCIYPRNYATNGKMLIITTDGSNPAVKNGIVTNGTAIEFSDNNSGIAIDFSYFPTRTKITIKAAYVSGMGVMSSISTMSFTIHPSSTNYVSYVNITTPSSSKLVPGKSLTLSAVVEPYASASQSVSWSIVSAPYAPGAKISSKGVLTTKKSDWGSITVRATSKANSNRYDEIIIQMSTQPLVKSIAINTSSVTLGYDMLDGTGTAQLRVTSLVNAYGQNVAGYSSYTVTWKSSNPNVVSVDENGKLTARSLGKATITCTANDGSKKSAKCTVTVVTPPQQMEITGQSDIGQGKKATYKVDVYPSNASKSVNWYLYRLVDNGSGSYDYYSPIGVSISTKGVITVSKSAPRQYLLLQAVSVTGSCTASKYLWVWEPTSYVKIGRNTNYDNVYGISWSYNNSGSMSVLNMYSADVPDTYTCDNVFYLTAYLSSSVGVTWTSSSPSIASITSWGKITAHKPGTATITCKANDGSGKKATLKVKVTAPASYVTVKSSLGTDDYQLLAYGKSTTHKVTLGDTYGKPSSAKVNWSWRLYAYDSDGNAYNYTSYAIRNKLVTLSSSGKLTISKNMAQLVDYSGYYFYVDVYATVNYAQHSVTGFTNYQIVRAPTVLRIENDEKYDTNSYRVYFYENSSHMDYTVTSSNPKVVNVSSQVYYNGSRCYFTYTLVGKGTAKITIKANDGSGKKVSMTIKVK